MPEITPEMLLLGVVWYVVFLLALTCHEGAHAWAALLGGDKTAYESGQVTLSPFPHMQREPFGTILVPLASYAMAGWMMGWASAPYDPIWAERYPRRAAWMAAAGPGANLALTIIAAVGIRLGVWLGVFYWPERISFPHVTRAYEQGGAELAAVFLSILFVLNLLLFLFNLLPVPPLDGATVITLFMDERMGRRFREFTQSWGMLGLLLAWYGFDYIFDPFFLLALNILYFPIASYG